METGRDKTEVLKLISLKNIDVTPNRGVKVKVLINDITPGINLLKGYIGTCPICNRTKIVFSKNNKFCSTLFKEEHEDGETTPCYGPKGGQIEIGFESINDTGYFCCGYDPEDTSGNPLFANVFFSNSIIPTEPKERFAFEIDIQTQNMIITGAIKILPAKKQITEWFIDVKDFEFEKKEVEVDYKLMKKYDGVARDDSFFEKYFTPKVYGKVLQKKINALDLLSPYQIHFPNNVVEYGVSNNIELGDPGQVKTIGHKEVLKYCEGTQSKFISVENSTMRGLIGAVIKNQNTGAYMVKVGELPLAHKCKVVMDGIGKLTEFDLAQLRGIQEEKEFQIIKAGNMKKHCAVRMTSIGNLIKPVKDYSTKHKASFDLSAVEGDKANKFSGADRRRCYHVTIAGDDDTKTEDIDTYLYSKYNPDIEPELVEYWNNLRTFAWNVDKDDFIWGDNVIEYARERVSELRQDYSAFTLDYGILSKGGVKIFLVQLPAVAVLHNSINEKKKVIIENTHADWLFDLYHEELRELGLDQENNERVFYENHAKLILENAPQKVKDILSWIKQYGSQSAVEKAEKISRMGIYRAFKEPISYGIKYEGQDGETTIFYSPQFGSGSTSVIGSNDYERLIFEEPDGVLPGITKPNGTLTPFGKILINLCKTKSVTPVTLVTVTPIGRGDNN